MALTNLLAASLVIFSGLTSAIASAENEGENKMAKELSARSYNFVPEYRTYDRTYGGYWWVDEDGTIHEEGITVEGMPLICTGDT